MRRGYLVGQEAVTVARMTGLGLSMVGYRLDEPGAVHPDAVTWEALPRVFIDLTRLDWWDRMRVTFARVAVYFYMRVFGSGHPRGDERWPEPVPNVFDKMDALIEKVRAGLRALAGGVR